MFSMGDGECLAGDADDCAGKIEDVDSDLRKRT